MCARDEEGREKLKRLISIGWILGSCCVLMRGPGMGWAAEAPVPVESPAGELVTLEGEVLEVEELKEPAGDAIFSVKSFATGETTKLYADQYRSLIWAGEKSKPVTEVLGGAKGTFVCRPHPGKELPVIVFAKVADA